MEDRGWRKTDGERSILPPSSIFHPPSSILAFIKKGAAMYLQKQSYYDKASHAVSDAWENVDDVTAARALGVASLVIGLSEILFPRKLQQTMGINNGQNTGVMRVLGVREICHGVDILSHRDPTPGVWARVAGDMLDGVLLGVAGAKSKR